MPSLSFSLFKAMMPIFRWSQSRFKTGDIDSLLTFRKHSEYLANLLMPLPGDIHLERVTICGVAGEWLYPKKVTNESVILFLHGGGIIFGWSNPNRRILATLVRFTGSRGFGVDYRLAPEFYYPDAHEDCFHAFQWLVQQGKKVVMVGESSGGGLALATQLRARKEGLPQPVLCILISPVVDFGFRESQIWNTGDVFAHPQYVRDLHQYYFKGLDANPTDLSPVDADLHGLAELYILAGEQDILRGEAERLAEAARKSELKVNLKLWPQAWHAWHGLGPLLPEATQALRHLGEVIRGKINPPSQ